MITKLTRVLGFFMIAAVFSGQADATFIGHIPVQYVTAGEKTTINLRRFCEPDAGDHLFIAPSGEYEAVIDPKTLELVLEVAPGRAGLVNMPIILQTSAGAGLPGERMGVMTLAVGKRHRHKFSYTPETKLQKVVAAGSFNGWSQDRTPLLDPDGDGTYEAFAMMDPGTHNYKFVVDGKWIADPSNPDKIDDGFQGFNSVIRVEGASGGNAPALYAAAMENWGWTIQCVPGADPVKEVAAIVEKEDGTSAVIEAVAIGNGSGWKIMRAGIPDNAWIRIVACDDKGRVSNTVRFRTSPPRAFDWNNAIVYYAFTDRFSNGNKENDMPVAHPDLMPQANWHGGDWRGIRDKIREGYFNDLGVNVLWLAPLNRNPSFAEREHDAPNRHYTGYHGYWPVSATEVEPHFGDAAELKALVADAHSRGIRVIADLVLNHVHESHPFVREHPEWIGSLTLPDGTMNLKMWDAHSYTTWFEPYLPDLNYDNEELVKTMFENAAWWAREYELDGFRLDAVKHIQPDIWRRFRVHLRNTIEQERGPLYLVGETFRDRSGIMAFVGPNGLDGQFDFPLYDTLKSIFAQGNSGFAELEASLSASERTYGKESLMAPLVGNHDKSRFMAWADGDLPDPTQPDEEEAGWNNPPQVNDPANYSKLKMGLTFLLSIDGVPTVYYGDEFGMSGAGDPDNRRDMRFGDDLSLYEKSVKNYCAAMAKIRQEHPALRFGSRRPVLVEENRYAYIRAFFEDRVLVAFNRTAASTEFALDVAPEFADGEYVNLVTGEDVKVADGKAAFTLRARSAAVIAPK
ncbi:MAG: alpha-amylase family glycosyl hydrolase, partial [Candidatus Hydrogenedentota bacterium]